LAVATTIGTVVAFLLVPMRSLGNDNWKIAAALMSRHIGGGQSSLHSLVSVTREIVFIFLNKLALLHITTYWYWEKYSR
jgi:uncharacterized membrane protein